MKHKFLKTTDGTKREICWRCGELKSETMDKCEPNTQGLITHVHKNGIEIFNIWKAIGLAPR